MRRLSQEPRHPVRATADPPAWSAALGVV